MRIRNSGNYLEVAGSSRLGRQQTDVVQAAVRRGALWLSLALGGHLLLLGCRADRETSNVGDCLSEPSTGFEVALAVSDYDFMNPPEGLDFRLRRIKRFTRQDLLDSSTGWSQAPPAVLPADLEFFPNDSGESLLVMNTGTVVWLDPQLEIRGQFQVDSANSRAQVAKRRLRDNEGVLGLTFDPGFEENRYFYVHLNPRPKSGVELWRLTWDPEALSRIWKKGELVFSAEKTQVASSEPHLHNHNGGNPSFGPDGKLYLAIGDGGIGGINIEDNEAQSSSSPWGKILRLDPAGVAEPELVASGLRNPFTTSWAGRYLFIGDVGADRPQDWEEINRLHLDRTPVNFGWPLKSGPCAGDGCLGFDDPFHGYGKADSGFIRDDPEGLPLPSGTLNRAAIILGPVYQGDKYGGYLDRVLVYADLLEGWVRGAKLGAEGQMLADRHLLHHHEPIISVARGAEGFLWMVAGFGGSTSIYRIEGPFAAPKHLDRAPVDLLAYPEAPLPSTLSGTGVFRDLANLTPPEGAWIYTPRYPLWKDGADKFRLMILPPGERINTRDANNWCFPVGTLIFKHFSIEVRRQHRRTRQNIETRVIQRTRDRWEVGVYAWREDGSDADLGDGRPQVVRILLDDQDPGRSLDYEIPGNAQCRVCHARSPSFVLGIEPIQLNPVADANDLLADLWEKQLVSHRISAPEISSTSASEEAVLGFLHGNCAHCHSSDAVLSPGFGLGFAGDLRRTLSKESLRHSGTLVVPGKPEASLLYQMVKREEGSYPMPPLSVSVPDPQGLSSIRNWIEGLESQ